MTGLTQAHLRARIHAQSATELPSQKPGQPASATRQVINRGSIVEDDRIDDRRAHKCANPVHNHVQMRRNTQRMLFRPDGWFLWDHTTLMDHDTKCFELQPNTLAKLPQAWITPPTEATSTWCVFLSNADPLLYCGHSIIRLVVGCRFGRCMLPSCRKKKTCVNRCAGTQRKPNWSTTVADRRCRNSKKRPSENN